MAKKENNNDQEKDVVINDEKKEKTIDEVKKDFKKLLKEKQRIYQQKESLCNRAVEVAEAGDLNEAINMMSDLCKEEFPRALNDTGVSYERLGDKERDAGNLDKAKEYWEIARTYYEKAKHDLAKKNYIQLLRNEKIPFDKEIYIDLCNYLMDKKDEVGYLKLSYLYQDDKFGCKDEKEAFRLIVEGIKHCGNDDGLIFEYGYLLEYGIGCKKDNHKSHLCYKSLLKTSDLAVVFYNYGLQCHQGRGCDKDENEAIKYLSIAAEKGYKDAMKVLISIYKKKLKNDTKKDEYFITED